MTNPNRQHWSDDRLNELADAVAANTRDIAQLREFIDINSRNIANLQASTANSIAALINVAQTQQTTINQTSNALYQISNALIEEIRGLRAENRKILEHLFGEQNDRE